MKKIENIAIIGAGALGIMYGEMLTGAYGKEHVFFAADQKRVENYRSHGFGSNHVPCDFRYESYDSGEKADLILFSVKYHGLEAAVRAAAPLVGEDTVMISVLNGVTSEEVIAGVYGDSHIVYCVAQGMDAVKEGNELTYKNTGVLVLGMKDLGRQELALEVQQVMETAGVKCLMADDIMHRMWSKLMLNTGVNQVCAVLGMNYGGVQEEGGARTLMIDSMREVIKVAEAEGIRLTEEDIDGWLKLTDSLNPDGMPSMRQDTKAGRKTEVELFSGTVRNLGCRHNIATPVNDDLYERIQKMERDAAAFYTEEIPEAVFLKMYGRSLKEGGVCARKDLRLVHALHRGFDGCTHNGEMVVNAAVAEDVLCILKELYEAEYQIEKMVLIDEYGADDTRSMEDNNSSAFNDRFISGTGRPSKHAYGLAVDINPLYNPYVKTKDGALICEPPSAIPYIDRSKDFPHKIVRGDICCTTFLKYGFTWGGDWVTLKDYQHFEK